MMEKKIRIGHVGLGHMHSKAKLESALARPDLFEVIGIVEPEEEADTPLRADGLAMAPQIPRMSLEQMLNADVDAVFIETDDWLMVKYARVCADAGLPMHLDKPAGEDVREFQALLSEMKKKNLTLQMGYMYRYNPAVEKAREMVREGRLGAILEVDAVMSTEHPRWIREWLTRFPGGTMHTFGCHLVDFLLTFQGVPERITAYARQTGIDGVAVNDHDLAVFEYPRGVSTIRTSSFEVNGFGRRQLVICGDRGTLELKPLETNHYSDFTPLYFSEPSLTKGYEYYDMKSAIRVPPILNRYDKMLEDFAAMVRGQRENPWSYEYEARLQLLSLAACGADVNWKEEILL